MVQSMKQLILSEITVLICHIENSLLVHEGENKELDRRTNKNIELHPLAAILKSLRSLKTEIAADSDSSLPLFSRVAMFSPFLDILVSPYTSGIITGTSLLSISKLVSFKALEIDGKGDNFACSIQNAISNITQAVCNTVFEASSVEEDEIVLSNILKALSSCLNTDGGYLLSDESMWEIFQTGWRCYADQTHTALLQSLAKDMLASLVHISFTNRRESLSVIQSPPLLRPFSQPLKMQVLGFFIAALNSNMGVTGLKASKTRILLLNLVRDVLQLGDSLLLCDGLKLIIQDDLCKALIFNVSKTKSGPALLQELSLTLQILTILVINFRKKLKLQVEAIFTFVFLKVLAKPEKPILALEPSTELVLEYLINITADSTFAVDMYVMYDCSLTSCDLLEQTVALLSKNVMPLKEKALSNHNSLALTGLLNIIRFLDKGKMMITSKESLDMGVVLERKVAKGKYKKAVSKFNEKPSDGIKSLVEQKLFSSPVSPVTIAKFFRESPGLDKRKIGEFLGKENEENQAVLTEFVKTFSFSSMNILEALRMFLETFRLPGEAQQIDRIMQSFANTVMLECNDRANFATTDVAYLLAFAIIMLNTDLHNPNIPEDRKMKLNDFVRLNSNYDMDISKGVLLDGAYLTDIYKSIKEHELITSEGDAALREFRVEMWKDLIIRVNEENKRELKGEIVDAEVRGAKLQSQLFSMLFPSFLAALSLSFANTSQEDELSDVLDGFLCCARIAHCYQSVALVDQICVTLANLSNLTSLQLQPSMPTTENINTCLRAFGLSHRSQMAAHTLFGMCHNVGSHIGVEGWYVILQCLVSLECLGALPSEFISEANNDILDAAARNRWNDIVDGTVVKGSKKEAKEEGGIFAWIGWGGNSKEVEEKEMHEREMEKQNALSKEFALKCVKDSQLCLFISETRTLDDKALTLIFSTIISFINKDHNDKEKEGDWLLLGCKENSGVLVFFLSLLTEMTLRNRDRVKLFIKEVADCLLKVATLCTAPSALLDTALSSLLTLNIRLFHKEDKSVSELLLQNVSALLQSENSALTTLSLPHIASGLRLLFDSNVDFIPLQPKVWDVLLNTINVSLSSVPSPSSSFSPSLHQIPLFDTLQLILNDIHLLSSCPLSLFPPIILQFIDLQLGSETRYLNCITMLVRIDHFNVSRGSRGDDLMISFMQNMCKGLAVPSQAVKIHTITSLQQIIDQNSSFLTGDSFLLIFENLIFKILFKIKENMMKQKVEKEDRKEKEEKKEREEKSVSKVHIHACHLGVKVFLSSLPRTSAMVFFPGLFIKIIDEILFMLSFTIETKKEALSSPSPSPSSLFDTAAEMLKNVMLVMILSDKWSRRECLGEGESNEGQSDMWKHAWTNIKNKSNAVYEEILKLTNEHFDQVNKK